MTEEQRIAAKTCWIYARCSTRDQDTENQLVQLRKYAEQQGWTVDHEVVEVVSGGKSEKDRPGMASLFAGAEAKAFDVVLFWALDRFSREGSRRTVEYLGRLDDAGVAWHSYAEPYISSLGIFKDAIIAILSALAKQEKVRISERTKAGLQRVREAGQQLGRPNLHPERAEQAQKMRADGKSYNEIAATLNISRSRAFQLGRTSA